MNKILRHTLTYSAFLAAVLFLGACATIQKSEPMAMRCDSGHAETTVTHWVDATYARNATLWQDGVIYTTTKDSPEFSRIELEWNAPDLHVREVFATVYLRQVKNDVVEVTVEERKDNVPLGRKYQNVAEKLRSAFIQAGLSQQ